MADPQTGMAKADMKRLLTVSKREPVHCAVAQGKEPAFALLMFDKVKSAKALDAALLKEFPDAKNRGFGTAVVDTEEDPKLAKFTLNKAPSGTARRIHKTLKGTGFTKVMIVDEDGQPLDSHSGEEEEEQAGAPAAAAPAAPAPAAAAAPPPPPPPADAAANAAALEKALAAMVPGIPKAANGRPDVQKQLVTLAQQAQAGIKGGDLNAAAASITALRTALAAAANAPAAAASSSAPTDAGATAGAVAFGKSRLAWLAARQKVMSDIEKLRAEIVSTYQEEGIAPELESSYRTTVQPIIDGFDTKLADDLDAAVNATDPAKRSELVGEAKATIGRYQKFLDGEPLIADLDDNPFVPLSIHATISNTLAALAKTVR